MAPGCPFTGRTSVQGPETPLGLLLIPSSKMFDNVRAFRIWRSLACGIARPPGSRPCRPCGPSAKKWRSFRSLRKMPTYSLRRRVRVDRASKRRDFHFRIPEIRHLVLSALRPSDGCRLHSLPISRKSNDPSEEGEHLILSVFWHRIYRR